MPWPIYFLSYRPRVRKLERWPVRQGDVVFIGDSITCWAKWDSLFPNVCVRNFGIPGDTSAGVLARIEQVSRGQPAKVFLLVGTNDLHFKKTSDEQIVHNITNIIDRLHAASSATAIYLQSIMPRHLPRAEQIKSLNSRLAQVALSHGAQWIDLWPCLSNTKGGLRRELTRDSLHLRPAGNRAWADALRDYVESCGTDAAPRAISCGSSSGSDLAQILNLKRLR